MIENLDQINYFNRNLIIIEIVTKVKYRVERIVNSWDTSQERELVLFRLSGKKSKSQ